MGTLNPTHSPHRCIDSRCLSVPCLTLSRKREGVGNWKLTEGSPWHGDPWPDLEVERSNTWQGRKFCRRVAFVFDRDFNAQWTMTSQAENSGWLFKSPLWAWEHCNGPTACLRLNGCLYAFLPARTTYRQLCCTRFALLAGHWLWTASCQLAVPSHRLSTYGRRAFAIAGPTTWNSLPTHLRRVENGTGAFGRSLKTHLYSEY